MGESFLGLDINSASTAVNMNGNQSFDRARLSI
jgi:hypothetical protein